MPQSMTVHSGNTNTTNQQQFAYEEIIKPWLLPPQMHFAAVSDSPNLDSHLCDIVPWQVLLLMN